MNNLSNTVFSSIVNLNQPGHYLHWSIFTVSVANLVIIAVMVVIFGLAVLLPFPRGKEEASEDNNSRIPPEIYEATGQNSNSADRNMWTARVRNLALKVLPPGKLLPDRQPAYVSSWIYVFGVATLAALGIVIVSGMTLAIGGPDWWHVNPIGHFLNSMHLWSVELFMAFMVIHLWGKFWMAAWRGKRKLTWITGVIAFVTSIIECFTGYLSQQNFDSQWIATNGKDAINATGLGTFFNLMNFGQMLMWHIVLIPLVLVALIGAHILLVRVRGVAHPIQKLPHGKSARRAAKAAEAMTWRGPTRRYDILKEGTIATIVVLVLVLGLATVLSSPDEPPVTVASWSKVAPADFMATATSELDGTSETASYGPPYSNGSSNVQRVGVSWQMLTGVHQPINTAQTFVLSPLSKIAPTDPMLAKALRVYHQASRSQQKAWDHAYTSALRNVSFVSGTPRVPRANDGPVPELVSTELSLAQSGAVDADLLAQQPFYGTNYTKPLLFMEDGNYFSSIARSQHLTGVQWGVMNETGSYPGQPWLWLYTLWYQVPGFSSSANVDLIAIYLTGLATLILLAVPFIPGLRDIPRLIPVHKLIWRKYNHSKANP
ncbi:MAG: cytochrome b N-terminal domain-containing protein [Candidatus Saccharimonadales bacterium]